MWTNWFGNQKCQPKQICFPENELEIQNLIRKAEQQNCGLRVVGSGHSLPAVVNTDGFLLDLAKLNTTLSVDVKAQTATISAGRKLKDIFDPLWESGFAMKNMGELADSSIAGAVSTGAHGTGKQLQCTSASVTGGRLVAASGEILEFSHDRDTELLRAAQVSVGMLGVFTELTIEVTPAYDLVERSKLMSVDQAVDGWEELISKHRHFSFYYIATPAAAVAFADQLPHLPAGSSDLCYAMIIDSLEPGAASEIDDEHARRDRMNRILTIEFDPNYREIEYAVPADVGMETFHELRHMVRTQFPEYSYPINVRIVAGDDAFLSAYNGGPKVVFSVSDDPNQPWDAVLAHAEKLFQRKGGLPHWGKEHALNQKIASELYVDFERFQKIRRQLDPKGLFLNDHLKEIFA